jgi:hypothetical protein
MQGLYLLTMGVPLVSSSPSTIMDAEREKRLQCFVPCLIVKFTIENR